MNAAAMLETEVASSDLADAFAVVVARRTSIRAFRPDPVPRAVLDRCFALAGRSPSNCNTQPWRVFVASGGARDTLASTLRGAAEADRWTPDFSYDSSVYTPLYSERKFEHGRQMFGAIGVARDDADARRKVVMRNMDFFGAPHAAFLFMPSFGGVREAGDVSLYAQTLMLALAAHGVGSCPQTTLGLFAEPVKAAFGIGSDLSLLYGIAIGYEDGGKPGSRIEQERASLSDSVVFAA